MNLYHNITPRLIPPSIDHIISRTPTTPGHMQQSNLLIKSGQNYHRHSDNCVLKLGAPIIDLALTSRYPTKLKIRPHNEYDSTKISSLSQRLSYGVLESCGAFAERWSVTVWREKISTFGHPKSQHKHIDH